MKHIIFIALLLFCHISIFAQNVTISVTEQPAPIVFRSIVEQTGKNFVYSSNLLKDMKITVKADNKPLKKVLAEIFNKTDIEYQIKGDNVILKRKKRQPKRLLAVSQPTSPIKIKAPSLDTVTFLEELVVVSRLENPVLETSEMGARKITAEDVRKIPSLFGENDVIKAIQMQPGVTDGTEGLAEMHVHGGNYDENLFMLDNVPLYQVNHFAGLFSAFNNDIIRYIDFFKTSVPAKYDGRLSSFMDVRLLNGHPQGHHGSARLGLTSGAFNIYGPIGKKTSYLVGLRRSWFDVLTIPIISIINSKTEDEKTRFRYAFMDFNAKVNHHFSDNITGFVSAYYGHDILKTGSEDLNENTTGWYERDHYNFNWGNLLIQSGMNWRLNQNLTAEFNAAFTRYFTGMEHNDLYRERDGELILETHNITKTHNNISDWIFRGDFIWQPAENSGVRFGANYIRHIFLPERIEKTFRFNSEISSISDSTSSYGGNEFNAYIEDDWRISKSLRANAGLHGSLFYLDGKTHVNLSPRLSLSWKINDDIALKGAYSHTVQYVHQLSMSYLSLPTDQWIPITGKFKPQTADKVALGAYWSSSNGDYQASMETYYKRMHNLVEYRDEYYLIPPLDYWTSRLTTGKGTAKGIDLMFEKKTGKFTGHIAYSLAWADRQFNDKNGGHPFPARFDNRHTIKIAANWNVSRKVTLSAAWTGHSGNHYTFMPQMWDSPDFGGQNFTDEVPLKTPVNNYQLPFYHRLDLSCNVRNKRGFWTFSLYNAYNHMNTVGIVRGSKATVAMTPEGYYVWEYKPVFQKIKLLPIIPSVSYNWEF